MEKILTFATHPMKPNFRSQTRGRTLHIKRDEKTTLCKMLNTETPISISLGYGFKADPNERGVCQTCHSIYIKGEINQSPPLGEKRDE